MSDIKYAYLLDGRESGGYLESFWADKRLLTQVSLKMWQSATATAPESINQPVPLIQCGLIHRNRSFIPVEP